MPIDPSNPNPEPPDAELVSAARLDPRAFDALYRRYVSPIYRFALSRLRSVAEAEDATAATFVEALTGLAGYTEQGRFPAWLFTIARRQIAAQRRKAARADAAHPMPPAAAGNDLLDRDLVMSALDTLAPEAREAVELRFFGDLKMREVAEILGKKESATKMMIHRSLRELRQHLSARDNEPDDGAAEQ